MHFIKDLIKNPAPENPVKNLPNVHRHFVRYSKGTFDGPALKIKFNQKTITIDGSFEFEDFLAWIGAKTMINSKFKDDFQISGSLISGRDFSEQLKAIGLSSWPVKKSTGKTKNYKCVLKIPVPINSEQLQKLIEELNSSCYILLNFNTGNVSLKTKKNPPRPNPKGSKDAKKSNSERYKFTKLKIPHSDEIRSLILDEVVSDFKDEILSGIKQIEILCEYFIKDLILPPKELMKNSKLFRQQTLRKGRLARTCVIDGTKYENIVDIKI